MNFKFDMNAIWQEFLKKISSTEFQAFYVVDHNLKKRDKNRMRWVILKMRNELDRTINIDIYILQFTIALII